MDLRRWREVKWLEPRLLAEVTFAEIVDGRLRAPAYRGLIVPSHVQTSPRPVSTASLDGIKARVDGTPILPSALPRYSARRAPEVSMTIVANPPESAVRSLLSEADLPTSDITPEKLATFFAADSGGELVCDIGLVACALHVLVACALHVAET